MKNETETDLSEWLRLWVLRLFSTQRAADLLVKDSGFGDDDTALLLGLSRWVDANREEFDRVAIKQEMANTLKNLEAGVGRRSIPDPLKKGLNQLGRVLGLNLVERRILLLLAIRDSEPAFHEALALFRRQTVRDYQINVARMLKIPVKQVSEALGKSGKLFEACVLRWRSGHSRTGWYPDFVSNSFAEKLFEHQFALMPIIRSIAPPAPAATLELSDFEHAQQHLEYLRPYMRDVVKSKRSGVNIFIHGAPGTGKSELVRLLAKDLRCQLYEVAFEDDDRDAVDGGKRLESLRAAQMLLGKQRSILVFDEAEDIFSRESIFRRSYAQSRKAWVNRLLETNPVPTFWVSNSLDDLDSAFVRRFDLIFELGTPPRKQRLSVYKKSLPNGISEKLLANLCNCDALTPAVVARAAAVATHIRRTTPEVQIDRVVEHLVTQTMKAQGHSTTPLKGGSGQLPTFYDISVLNCDTPLAPIADGMDANSSCRICLYGAPGTGKTTFGYWLAEKLGLPLHTRRASDILGPYVGESEQRIARTFQKAEEEGAILLLDEVDTFLQDRRGAHRSWEVSLVNEMLTQMECFTGIFIASTNLMDGLDEASLRRFDLKLRFGFLHPDQAVQLLMAHCENLNLNAPSPEDIGRLRCIENATPGDFANAARQHRFKKFSSSSEYLSAVAQECEHKAKRGGRKVGF